MKILTWNVNGLRAVLGKGLLEWMNREKPDVLCLQEIKSRPDQLPEEFHAHPGWHKYLFPAQRPGYSGTALFTREKPDEVWQGIGMKEADEEGRVLAARFGNLHVISAYFPNSQPGGVRKAVKLKFCESILKKINALKKKGAQVVLCGDYNIAHTEIDLARPKENEENPGFFPWEREAMTQILASGWHDIFREQHPKEPNLYTWWSFRGGARSRNVGWRIDYICISPDLKARAGKASILPEVMGSDHCPVGLALK